jgi:hypothetical protein
MKLWIGNIAPGTQDEEIRDLVIRYGAGTVGAVEHVPGDGSRPAAMVEVAASQAQLLNVTQRLNGLYWKGRSLTVQGMTR